MKREVNCLHRCLDALMLLNCNLIEAQPTQVCHGFPQKWPAIEIPHTVDGDVPFADVFAHSLSEPTVANASTSTRNIKKLIEVHALGGLARIVDGGLKGCCKSSARLPL